PLQSDGKFTIEDVKKTITNRTKIVAVSKISNVLGIAKSVKQLASVAHKHAAVILMDGAQSVSQMKVDVQELNSDFY
ncbi:aminotransferase class V-fold PLP-dependent enzyme, partial [Bacillus cereus group sp. N15]|uniref:aminotransferase class V-fold PLP-dependent enzyme n=1 Tax=Bacillus cereus group sp. N15 TaxID=2794588 RepID=UPI0018F70DC7